MRFRAACWGRAPALRVVQKSERCQKKDDAFTEFAILVNHGWDGYRLTAHIQIHISRDLCVQSCIVVEVTHIR